jgi:hypothetical protein
VGVEELQQRQAFADRGLRQPGDRARLSKRGVVTEDRSTRECRLLSIELRTAAS